MKQNPKIGLFLLVLTTITTVSFFVLKFSPRETDYTPGVSQKFDQAVAQAKKVYQDKKTLGIDFSSGPCLTNDLMPDWVADIVHDPKTVEDDLPQNQCQAFLEGRARHFVELDRNGGIVRIY